MIQKLTEMIHFVFFVSFVVKLELLLSVNNFGDIRQSQPVENSFNQES